MRTVALTDQDEMEWVKAHPAAKRIVGIGVYYWVDDSEETKPAKICVPLKHSPDIGTRRIPLGLLGAYLPILPYYLRSGMDITIGYPSARA